MFQPLWPRMIIAVVLFKTSLRNEVSTENEYQLYAHNVGEFAYKIQTAERLHNKDK